MARLTLLARFAVLGDDMVKIPEAEPTPSPASTVGFTPTLRTVGVFPDVGEMVNKLGTLCVVKAAE